MPDGVKSLADLVVRIGADASGLKSGLGDVSKIIAETEKNTGLSLASIDRFVQGGASSLGGLASRLTAVGRVIATAETALQLSADVAEKIANAVGAGEEYSKVEQEVAQLSSTLGELAQQKLGDLKEKTAEAAVALLSFGQSVETANDASGNFLQRSLSALAEQVQEFRGIAVLNMAPESLGLNDLHLALETAGDSLERLKQKAAEVGADEGLSKAIAGLEMRAFVLNQMIALERMPWTATVDTSEQDKFIGRLEDEVELLEKRATLLGLSAADQAQSLAAFKFRKDAESQGIGFADEQEGNITALLARQATAQRRLDDDAAARRSAEQSDRLIDSLERDVQAERSRAAAMGLSAAEAARLAFEERALSQIRASGRAASENELRIIKALADEKGRAVQASEDLRASQARLAQASQLVGRTVETAFENAFSGTKTNWKELVATLLKDFAMLQVRASLIEPLFGGGSGGGNSGGVFGSILSSLFSAGSGDLGTGSWSTTVTPSFGGFRADGGPVEAGKSYVVGERGPELFIPARSGAILPNDRIGDGGQNVRIAVTVNGARGNREISQMVAVGVRQGLGEYDKSLPGRIGDIVERSG